MEESRHKSMYMHHVVSNTAKERQSNRYMYKTIYKGCNKGTFLHKISKKIFA